jgi:hypothetical protein
VAAHPFGQRPAEDRDRDQQHDHAGTEQCGLVLEEARPEELAGAAAGELWASTDLDGLGGLERGAQRLAPRGMRSGLRTAAV